jgi:hypothetical protein
LIKTPVAPLTQRDCDEHDQQEPELQRRRDRAGMRDQGGAPGGADDQAREDLHGVPDGVRRLAGREPPGHGGQRAGQVRGRQAASPEAVHRAALHAEGGGVEGEQRGEPAMGGMTAQRPPDHGIPGQQDEFERQRPSHRGRPRPVAGLRLPGDPGTCRHAQDIARDRGHDQTESRPVAGTGGNAD